MAHKTLQTRTNDSEGMHIAQMRGKKFLPRLSAIMRTLDKIRMITPCCYIMGTVADLSIVEKKTPVYNMSAYKIEKASVVLIARANI